MSTDLTVESIVAQIRKRIAEESGQGSNSQPKNGFPVAKSNPLNYRKRMAEDSRVFIDLDTQVEGAAAKIGGQPPVPPTWRGRFGSWVIRVLQRLLWWYSTPLRETFDLLNLRNREQAIRHLRMQEQVVSLMDGLQQVLNRTETIETFRREVTGWQDENRVSRREVQRQLQELERNQTGTRSQVTALVEQAAKVNIRSIAEKLTLQLEELREARIQTEQNFRRQSDQMKGSLQELQGSLAASDSLHSELERRVLEAARMTSGRLPDLEAQLRAEVKGQIDELNGKLQELGVSRAGSGFSRAEVEQQLLAEGAAREAVAGEIKRQMGRLEQKFGAQVDECRVNLQELRIFSAASDSHRAELAQRVSEVAHAAESDRTRLPVLETQLQTEAHAREILAAEINRHMERLEQHVGVQVDEFRVSLQELRASSPSSNALRAELEQRVSETVRMAWARLPVLDTQLHVETEAREALATEMNGRVERLEQKINDGMVELAGRASHLALVLEKQRNELLAQEHRLSMFLREVRNQLPKALSEVQVRQMTENLEDTLASLYADFEDVFRGPRDEIKERLKVYIPRLEQANGGSLKGPVLDLGCGRGEWLELLSEHNFIGHGVDANSIMVSRCGALGLEVIQADALAHLRSLPDKSLGAVTSFHMIEHLPFETVIEIVDEALRVLRSGGLLILETPNSQNVLVGSQTFWIDPTHVRPIPSQTLRFFMEARGFCQVDVLHLQPYPEAVRVPETCGGVAQRFNEYFYGPQDYGIIGQRP